ncbi:MAG TPA: hypothetical protein VHV10_06925, partial [Ktedonobacteraceae bacterium]|nr:hypothetical protein [Ktedonobacteraceae bacterium]
MSGYGSGFYGSGFYGAGPYPTSVYHVLVLADRPQAYYRLGETSGTVAHDSSGNGNDATLTGVSAYSQAGAIAGDADTSMLFTASGAVTLPYTLNLTTWTAFTLGFWINPGTGWQYVAVTSDATSTILYFDGAVTSSGSGAAVFISSLFDYAGNFTIAGNLDEIEVYNYKLSSGKIFARYVAGFYAPTAPRALTVNIDGIIYPVKEREFRLQKAVDQTSKCIVTVFDSNGSAHFQRGQEVTVADTLLGVRFTGFVYSPVEKKIAANNAFWHTIDCRDNHESAGCRTTNKQYKTPQYAGVIVADTVNDVLSAEGVVGNFALRHDDDTTSFGQGTLSGTRAVNNGLELALAGSQVVVTEATTSDFSSGSLQLVTAANNTLKPTSAKAIK